MVVAIAAILAAIAIPNFQSMLDRQRTTTLANDLYASVTYARAEAIRRGTRVDLLPTDAANWANGWQISVSPAAGATATAPAVMLYQRAAASNGTTMKATFNPEPTDNALFYDGTGRTRTRDSSATSRSVNWIIILNQEERHLDVNAMGRPSLCDPTRPPCP